MRSLAVVELEVAAQVAAAAMPCGRFYELGTYHAATIVEVQRLLQVPVWNCEVNCHNCRYIRAVAWSLPYISLANESTRDFLPRICPQLKRTPEVGPYFYLERMKRSWILIRCHWKPNAAACWP